MISALASGARLIAGAGVLPVRDRARRQDHSGPRRGHLARHAQILTPQPRAREADIRVRRQGAPPYCGVQADGRLSSRGQGVSGRRQRRAQRGRSSVNTRAVIVAGQPQAGEMARRPASRPVRRTARRARLRRVAVVAVEKEHIVSLPGQAPRAARRPRRHWGLIRGTPGCSPDARARACRADVPLSPSVRPSSTAGSRSAPVCAGHQVYARAQSIPNRCRPG